MPSTRWRAVVAALALLVFGYSFVVGSQPLLGVVAAVVVYLAGWLLGVAVELGSPASFGTARTAVVAVGSVAILLYALLVAGQILLGVVAVALFVFTAWMTSPAGPFVD